MTYTEIYRENESIDKKKTNLLFRTIFRIFFKDLIQ